MKFLVTALLVAIFGSALAAPAKHNTYTTNHHVTTRQTAPEEPGCNTNVCFVLDGSSQMSLEDFDLQKEFVLNLVAAIAGSRLEAAAVQLGLRLQPISPITSSINDLFLDVINAPFGRNRFSFLGGGIIYCTAELNRRPNEASKIVVIGDGRSLFGARTAKRYADNFRASGGDVCGVFVGTGSSQQLESVVGSDRLLQVDSFLQLGTLIEALVIEICGAPQPIGLPPVVSVVPQITGFDRMPVVSSAPMMQMPGFDRMPVVSSAPMMQMPGFDRMAGVSNAPMMQMPGFDRMFRTPRNMNY